MLHYIPFHIHFFLPSSHPFISISSYFSKINFLTFAFTDYTGNKNNGHEDNTKEVSNCNTKYNLSTSNNFKCGDGASCKTCSNSFHCKRKVRFNLKCKQEKRTKRKTKPVSIPVRNCLLTKRCTNRYSSFKRKPKKNMVSCDVNQKADSVGKSNYNRVETAINDMPKRTSCTLTKLQCPKEVREVEVVGKSFHI